MAAKSFMSARKTVVRTTCAWVRPAAASSAPMFWRTRARLRGDVAVDQLAGGRVEGHLSGDEQELAGPERPASRARWLWALRLARWPAWSRVACMLRGLDDLLRPQAARADADPLDAAVDRPRGRV